MVERREFLMCQVKFKLAHSLPVRIAIFPVIEIKQFVPQLFGWCGIVKPGAKMFLNEGVITQLGDPAEKLSVDSVGINTLPVIKTSGDLVDD